MDKGIAKVVIVCFTVMMVALFGCLSAIAIMRDSNSESQIVTVMVGLPAILVASIAPIVQTYLHKQGDKIK